MSKFINELRNLVAANRLEEMIRQLMDSLSDCEHKLGQSGNSVKEIRNNLIQYSARLNNVKSSEDANTLSHDDSLITRSKILTSLLHLIDDLHNYPDYLDYLNNKEEDDAWKTAKSLNNIDTYQAFFEKYPEGKYKEETRKIIAEIKVINQQRDAEIQQRVQAERDRREREEAIAKQKVPAAVAPPTPLIAAQPKTPISSEVKPTPQPHTTDSPKKGLRTWLTTRSATLHKLFIAAFLLLGIVLIVHGESGSAPMKRYIIVLLFIANTLALLLLLSKNKTSITQIACGLGLAVFVLGEILSDIMTRLQVSFVIGIYAVVVALLGIWANASLQGRNT